MKRRIKVSVSGWFHNSEDLRDKKITFLRCQYFGGRGDSIIIIPNTMPIHFWVKQMDNRTWQDPGFGVSQFRYYVYET